MNESNIKICLRRRESKERIFDKYGILKDNNGKKLATSILKIDNFIKNSFEYFEPEVIVK